MKRELIEPEGTVSIRRQCELLGVNRSSLYYKPVLQPDEELRLMRRIDEMHLKWPFFGSRRITAILRTEGLEINRKRVIRLMRLMGIEGLAPRPKTSQPAPEHTVYPYLLRNRTIERPNEVWALDITYVPMAHGFAYLVAVLDWHTRRVLAWRLSNTMEARFCCEAIQEALERFPRPEIVNTDQGAQFTAAEFTAPLKALGIAISMDGRGRWIENVFIERLWRSVKYEEIYLHAYDDLAEARQGLGAYFEFYNHKRPHQALGDQPPARFYELTLRPPPESTANPQGIHSSSTSYQSPPLTIPPPGGGADDLGSANTGG